MYTDEQLSQLRDAYDEIQGDPLVVYRLFESFPFSIEAREHYHHGFLRRMAVMRRCMQNVFEIFPPWTGDRLKYENGLDMDINIQGFMFHTYGCMDNMAWMLATQRQFPIEKNSDVGLQKKVFRTYLTPRFKAYLNNIKAWLKYTDGYRHALTHRIPLYVPPVSLDKEEQLLYTDLESRIQTAMRDYDFDSVSQLRSEQDTLGRPSHIMTHSFREKSDLIFFHAQMIADWNTILEIAGEMLHELESDSEESRENSSV